MPIIHEAENSLRTERQLEQDQKIIGDRDVKLSSMRMADPEGQSLLGQLAIMYAAKKHP
ncbi:hypothetical protein CROQUDRAFT_106815 [Cronartium quercuum f. sp. fusiforme G11]|uniref:Uncharacterized protein n=1 Tax=Cronartium quercuum f. sp. fusiforme G11 TaxID=708437 RepID=A0A9P6NNX9_9BASI|nr:hypothetical protein CROQUDRAFT_106815 [Cronartium quercuum f. sp. fusiforme G11]